MADRPVVDRPVAEERRPEVEDRPAAAADSKPAEVAELAQEERELEPHQLFLFYHQRSSSSSESDAHDALLRG